jgi:hypothetical protein
MVSANVKPVEEWRVGEHVTCPRCGRVGKVAISTFRAKGKEYTYWVVNHPDKRKCVIERVGGPKAEAKAAPITTFAEEGPAQVPVEEERVEAERRVEIPGLRALEEVRGAVNRYGWYAFLVGRCWGAVTAAVEGDTPEGAVSHFRNQARKLIERLGIPAEEAVAAVEAYAKNPSNEGKRVASEKAADLVKQVCWILADAVAAAVQKQAAPQPAFDAKAFAEAVAEEVRKRVEEAVKTAQVPEVVISEREYAVMHAVYRGKRTEEKRKVAEKYGIPEEKMGEVARSVWDRVFAPGRKIVVVEGRSA